MQSQHWGIRDQRIRSSKVNLGYVEGCRPVWARDLVSNKWQKQKSGWLIESSWEQLVANTTDLSVAHAALTLEAQVLSAKGSLWLSCFLEGLTHSRPTYLDQFPSHQGNSCSQRSFRLHFGFGSKDSVQKMGDTDVNTQHFLINKIQKIRTF